jgi:hypothetical protein
LAFLLASAKANRLNQNLPDSGIPPRFKPKTARSNATLSGRISEWLIPDFLQPRPFNCAVAENIGAVSATTSYTVGLAAHYSV